MSEIRLLMATHAGLYEVRISEDLSESRVQRLFAGHWHGLTKLQNSYLGFRRPPFGEDRHAWSEAYEINADLTKRARFGGAALRGLDGVHQAIAADGGIYIIGSNEFSDRTDRADAEGELVVVDADSMEEVARFNAAPEDADVSGNINDLLQIAPASE